MTAHSSGVSFPGLSRIESGMPILPISWSGAVSSSVSTKLLSRPNDWAMARQ